MKKRRQKIQKRMEKKATKRWQAAYYRKQNTATDDEEEETMDYMMLHDVLTRTMDEGEPTPKGGEIGVKWDGITRISCVSINEVSNSIQSRAQFNTRWIWMSI